MGNECQGFDFPSPTVSQRPHLSCSFEAQQIKPCTPLSKRELSPELSPGSTHRRGTGLASPALWTDSLLGD